MEIDFKHYRYQRPGERKKRKRRNLTILIIFIIGFSLLAWDQVSSYYVIRGKKLILKEKYNQAEKILYKALSLKRRKAEINEALGICYLFQKKKQASKYFQIALQRGIKKSFFKWEKILDKLIGKGEYNSAEIYCKYLKKWLKSQNLIFYETTILLANYKIKEAEKNIINYSPEILKKFSKRINLQKKILNKLKNKKIFYFIFDRTHKPLYGRSIKKAHIIPVHSNLPLFNWKAFSSEDFKNQIILTINSKIQDSAIKALGKYNGSIIVINPQTGEILAAVNKKGKEDISYLNTCFQKLYEPGSIIKILTAVAYLMERKENIFPYYCKGIEKLQNKVIYDWISHGKVENLTEALAFSCNLTFARIGLNLGWKKIENVFKDFLMHSKIEIQGIPVSSLNIPQPTTNNWDLARMCIGLDKFKITPFHAALIASIIANRGVLMKPFLIKEKRNIYGIPYFKNFPSKIKRIISEEINYKLREAMIKVVEDGTGKRAKIQGFKFALKTGTAGKKEKGYNSILIGFAPAFNPKIAFSIFAEGAGRADLEGARITKKFLEYIKEELK